MLCQNCQKRVANIQFTQVINSNKHVMYLCEQCAKEEGKFSLGSPLSINDFFSGIMGFPYMASVPQQSSDLVCDECGMGYDEFKKVGKLGCANCYKVYGEKLAPLLKRLHGNTQYHGKIPGKVYKIVKASREIEKLKEELDKAIKSEEYEKAAKIRDQIRSLESKDVKL
ncbi:MAG: UvrB/UvrC motif-containing protein [Bacillota bacterium]